MRRALRAAAALLLCLSPHSAAPPSPAPCRTNALCHCRVDHVACNYVPFHRFPDTEAHVWHVSVSAARLGALAEAALDGRRLRTLVLVASHLQHIDPGALTSMESTLASLDLGYNEFTEVPLEALRELKVLNWLNLQNNYISEIDSSMDWGFLTDSLTSLSLSNNNIDTLNADALASLHHLAQLELDGNRLHAVAGGSLPPSLALLRLSDNLLRRMPCAALVGLPRLRHLHLRNNMLQPITNVTCRTEHSKIDSLDLSHNELDDRFELGFQQRLQLKQLILDLNDFTSVPSFVLDIGRLEKLSIAYNKLVYLSDMTVQALKRDLERLDLDHNELTLLPRDVRDLSKLRHLSVSYNRLANLTDLPPLLHSLSLAGNFLTSFPPALWDLAPATLAYLDLGYNRLSEVSEDSFGAWSDALATLNLKGNRIAQVASDAFPASLPVRKLLLSFNELYQVETGAFTNLTYLQVLEVSSALFSGEFPIAPPGDGLTWLTLDNNNIHYVTLDDILNFPSLQYLNLDFNKIIDFPSEFTTRNRSSRLKELRLAYNFIFEINGDSLEQFTELQSVDISYNRVQNMSEHSFVNLLNMVYLNLAGNMIEWVSERAFSRLPRLEVLDMQDNRLLEFSTNYFENVSNEEIIFSVNVSYNRISSLVPGGPSVAISILDLSHNLIENLSNGFFEAVKPFIRQILLSNNKIMFIDNTAFGYLPRLDVLNLHGNNISAIKRRAFAEMPALQILDLSQNRIGQLSVEQFHNMRCLRHLRLDANELRSLPRDCFKNTILEYIELSDNRLVIFPSSALAQVGFTLRRLELAQNRLEYLDAAMFHSIAFLHELSLARNALTVLSDNTFAGVPRLRRLDLAHNAIKTNFKELFHYLPRLRRLSLAGASLRAVPHLPLANLTELDLSGNHVASYRERDVRQLTRLRVLDLSRNRLTSLQPAMWAGHPRLTFLDVAANPIVQIARGSLEGLHTLRHLRMDRLRHLEGIEPRAFRSLASLLSLTLESPAAGRRGGPTPADIASFIPALESLALHVRESALEGQLARLCAPKLRVLELCGGALRHVSAGALSSLGQQRALAVRVRGTGVGALPAGLLRPLAHVPHLALELTDNQLVSFDPATLYPNLTGWDRVATKLLPGGLVVSGNRLRCGCSVRWAGAWLRRWVAEVGGGARGARDAALRSTCRGARAAMPLLLLPDDAECHASALAAGAAPLAPIAPVAHTAAALCIALLYAVS